MVEVDVLVNDVDFVSIIHLIVYIMVVVDIRIIAKQLVIVKNIYLLLQHCEAELCVRVNDYRWDVGHFSVDHCNFEMAMQRKLVYRKICIS